MNQRTTYALQMVAAIIERGDDQIRDGWDSARYSDANWVADLLLAQLGYQVRITEDGAVEIWPKDPSSIEPGTTEWPLTADHYRFGQVNGQWHHTRDAFLAADAADRELVHAMDTLDRMAQHTEARRSDGYCPQLAADCDKYLMSRAEADHAAVDRGMRPHENP